MAVLTTQQRAEVLRDIMRDLSDSHDECAINKAALLAAIDATDDWQDSNAASYNSALPTAARNNLTAAQKNRLFTTVAKKRWGG